MASHLNNFCYLISYISVPSTTVSPSFSIMLWTSWIWSSLPSSLWRWYSNWSPSNPGWVIQTHRYTPLYIITQFPIWTFRTVQYEYTSLNMSYSYIINWLHKVCNVNFPLPHCGPLLHMQCCVAKKDRMLVSISAWCAVLSFSAFLCAVNSSVS